MQPPNTNQNKQMLDIKICREETSFMNAYVLNTRAITFMKQKLEEMQGEIDQNTFKQETFPQS